MTRLRQICCEPRMLYENYKGESTKFTMCLELIETLKENGKSSCCFQVSIWWILLSKSLISLGIKYHMITGAVDKKKRKEEVDAFQSDDSDVFLISYWRLRTFNGLQSMLWFIMILGGNVAAKSSNRSKNVLVRQRMC